MMLTGLLGKRGYTLVLKRGMSTSQLPANVLKGITNEDGQFIRKDSIFRQKTIAKEDAEQGRYILYASYSCPWAARALIARSLKKLENYIDVSTVDRELFPEGWTWTGRDGTDSIDPVHGYKYLKEVYKSVDPDYQGRVTVPVLYDKKTKQIVNNESSEIIRIFNEFPADTDTEGEVPDLYPDNLRAEIDEINDYIYNRINNGVYKTGFATRQASYDEHVHVLFESLDRMESLLSGQEKGEGPRDFVAGPGRGTFTEADLRLWVTLARFDAAYYTLFRCNLKRLREYPNLHRFFKALYDKPAFKKWTDFYQIRAGYSGAAKRLNDQEAIVPIGPLDIL